MVIDTYGRVASAISNNYLSVANVNFTLANVTTANIVTANVTSMNVANLSFNSSAIPTTIYDLDDISYLTDGHNNMFALTYNTANVAIASPWNLFVSVEGAPQPAFQYNYDTVWLAKVFGTYKGYTINYDGNIEFSDAPQSGSQVLMRTVPGLVNPTIKTYPFVPTDILMGD